MGKIIAIGGGDIGLGETRKIDEFIVSQSQKQNPKLLIVPTACHNNPEYISEIKRYILLLAVMWMCFWI